MAITTGGSSDPQISVNGNETLTITINGAHKNTAFQMSAMRSGLVDTVDLSHAEDYIEVQDYTGNVSGQNGHHFKVKFSLNSWNYTGNDLDFRRPDIDDDAGGLPIKNKMRMVIFAGTSSSLTFTPNDSNVCTAGTGTMSISTVAIKKDFITLGRNTSSCAGISKYSPRALKVRAPKNGLGVGTYSQNITVLLIDGQS